MKLQDFPQFILPRPRTDDATTSHCIKFRYSNTFHAVVVYYSLDEVLRLLLDFDWRYHTENEKALGPEEAREYKYMQLLWQTVVDGGAQAPAATSTADAELKAGADGGGGGGKDDESDMDRLRKRTRARTLAKASSAPRILPSAEALQTHPDIAALLERPYKLFVGRGKQVLDDRVYIRHELEGQLNGIFRALIKDVCVFAPCLLLEGKMELVDTPGLNDGDALRARNINKQLKCSDHLVVCCERSLGTEENTLEALEQQRIFDRLFHDNLRPGRGALRLSVLLLPERLQQLSGEEILKNTVWTQRTAELVNTFDDSDTRLFARLETAAQARYATVSEEDRLSRVQGQLEKIEVLSCYPILYLSAMLNVGYRFEQPNIRNLLLERTDGKNLVALLVTPRHDDHLNGIAKLQALAQQHLLGQEERLQLQAPLPEKVCKYAKTLAFSRGEIVVRENRLKEIVAAIQGDARFLSASLLFGPGTPAADAAQRLGTALEGAVEAAKDWLLAELHTQMAGKSSTEAVRALRGYMRRNDSSANIMQMILDHQQEIVTGAKQEMSVQIEAAREGLLACVTQSMEHHLTQSFVNCINLNSPDGGR